ncbi:MAG: Dam family site-specific DNA-(adenine-N6)-methyltransferase [Alphaproteobacteria bacterium]|nr:MAG: Dam family site-specific DNA-(adenine-N6)-methyltransferase [Alphaproteobacteria bacterium]
MAALVSAESEVVPFIKWAGGKRWLVSAYPGVFPGSFRHYIEPFLGSGAVFFHLSPSVAHLSDLNPELVNAFNVLKTDWKKLRRLLEQHQSKHSEQHYYEVRAWSGLDGVAAAARFIYLNRTCWNGLYRVNKGGKFNVPKGSRSSVLLRTDDFQAIAARLAKATIEVSDFEQSIENALEGDLVFVDPPYTVKHNLNGFVKYNDQIFSWEDQIRLSRAIVRAKRRGAIVVMTNANHQSIRDLYKDDFRLRAVKRATSLAADSTARGETSELLITT